MAAVSVRGPVRFDPRNRGERASAAKFRRLAKTVLLRTVHRGDSGIRAIKSAASEIRRVVFEGEPVLPSLFFNLVGALGWTSPELALQLSFIGRALPFGSDEVVKESLETHKQVMGTLSVTPPMILAAARPWARKWAKAHRLDLSGFKPVSVQESSCLEFTRKEGGFAKGVSRLLVGARLPAPDALPRELRKGEYGLFSRLRASAAYHPGPSYVKVVAGMHYRDGKPRTVDGTHGVVVSLPERGFKARIVSRHHSARVAFLHQFRMGLAEALRRDKRVREVVAGSPRKAVESMFSRGTRCDGVLLSADLTAASDRLPHDLLREIWAGLFDEAELPAGVNPDDILNLAIGPYNMKYPDGTEVTMKQGILMGLPTTWPLLCLVMSFWADLSNEAPDSGRLSTGDRNLGESERICGDDLIAWWRPERVVLFEEIAQQCGAKFSAGKHLRSRRWGIFTEEIFDVRLLVGVSRRWGSDRVDQARKRAFGWHRAAQAYVERELNCSLPVKYCPKVARTPYVFESLSAAHVRWSRCIPLRWAVRVPRRLAGSPVQSLPEWFCIGPAAWSVASSTGMWKEVDNVRRAMYPGVGRVLASSGIPPFLPRSLGGGGLPFPSGLSTKVGRVCSRQWRRAIGSGIYRSTPTDLPGSAWRSASSPAYELAVRETRKLLTRPEVKVTRHNAGRPGFSFEKAGDLDDYMENRSAKNILYAVVEARAPLTGDLSVGIYDVSRALRREVNRLSQKGGYLKSSAPLARLVRKHHRRDIWFAEPEEVPGASVSGPRGTFASGLSGLNLALQLRMRQSGGVIPPG
jgi:hypothetical protein